MRYLLLFALLACAVSARASVANVYLANASAGGDTGADCANAHAVTFFNSAGNWGAGGSQIGSDTIVHLCGTITVALNSTVMTCQGSGTSGHPVTIKWETGAIVTSVAMGDGIVCNNRSNIVFDGGTNGIIRNTANCASCANHVDSAAINIDGTSNAEVHHLSILDMYVRDQTTDACQCGNGIQSNSSTAVSGVHFHHNTISQVHNAILLEYQGSSNDAEIDHNTLSGATNLVQTGDRTTGSTFTNYRIHDNTFSGGSEWGNQSGGAFNFHVEHIHLWALQGSSVFSTPQIYNNTFSGDCGVNCTALVFIEGNVNAAVFNNTFKPSTNGTTNATLSFKGPSSLVQAYNNTIDCNSTGGNGIESEDGSGPITSTLFKNNVIINCGNVAVHDVGTGTISVDYDNYFGNNCVAVSQCTFAGWQGAGNDSHGKNTNPGLDASYHPTSGASAVVSSALNLTSLGFTALDSDAAGVARPSGATLWDIGAFQFASGGSTIQGTVTGNGSIKGTGSFKPQ